MSHRVVCSLVEALDRMMTVLETGDHMHEHDHDHNDELQEEINALIESDSLPEPAAASACGPLGNPDEVEDAIQGWILQLRQAGYAEDADDAVYDAMSELIEASTLEDTPPTDAPPAIKQQWVFHFHRAIRDKLLKMGLEF